MKLSEAIRKGSLMKPQGFGQLFVNGENKKYYHPYDIGGWDKPSTTYVRIIHSCALGAAMDAITDGDSTNVHYPTVNLRAEFPILKKEPLGVNVEHLRLYMNEPPGSITIEKVIIHLNDSDKWTRERIADWVEEQEKKFEKEEQIKEIEQAVNSPDNLIKEQAYTYTS